jgi:hypothetical protein
MESSSFEFGLPDSWMDRMLSLQYNLDAIELWIERNNVEMERYRTILESNDTGTHSAERSFWDTAPCTSPSLAYLTVVPVSQASDISLVQVLHVICDVPSSTPPPYGHLRSYWGFPTTIHAPYQRGTHGRSGTVL